MTMPHPGPTGYNASRLISALIERSAAWAVDDAIVGNSDPPVNSSRVGRVQWMGRCTDSHHRGTGPARHVDLLKGVNMSFTSEALADLKFDESLRGSGAGVLCDLAISLDVRRKGWRLIYDPALVVDLTAPFIECLAMNAARGPVSPRQTMPTMRLEPCSAIYPAGTDPRSTFGASLLGLVLPWPATTSPTWSATVQLRSRGHAGEDGGHC